MDERLKHCDLSTIPKRVYKPKPPKKRAKKKICSRN